MELLDRLGIPSAGEFVLKSGNEPFSDLLLGFLRVISMSKNGLEYWLQSDEIDHLLKQECLPDRTVDESFKKYLETRLKILIANYPTTREVRFSKIKPNFFQDMKIFTESLTFWSYKKHWENNFSVSSHRNVLTRIVIIARKNIYYEDEIGLAAWVYL